MPETRVVTI